MIRTFKYFSILATGVPQPWVFTTCAQAVTAKAQLPQGDQVNIAVADSSLFQVGDSVRLMNIDGTNDEAGTVVQIPSANVLGVKGIGLSHLVGAWVIMSTAANSPYLQAKLGNAAAFTIGAKWNMNPATGLWCTAVVAAQAAGQPYDYSTSRSGLANPDSMGNFWITGTAADSYLPSMGVV
jgi:hypothetical protein